MRFRRSIQEHSRLWAQIGESKLVAVQKLSIVTQMTVYKDVIPGYRIRPASEDAPGEKLSKDVRNLRTYEQALVSGYQGYIKVLAKLDDVAGRNRQGRAEPVRHRHYLRLHATERGTTLQLPQRAPSGSSSGS